MIWIGALLLLVPLAYGGLQQVSEIRVGDRIEEPWNWGSVANHAVTAIAYSQDGTQLAVALDGHPGRGIHVLVLDLARPAEAPRQFNVETCGAPLSFAPSGEAILICGIVIRLTDGAVCEIARNQPGAALWLDSRHIISAGDHEIFDVDCEQSAPGTADGWTIVDTAPAFGWVLVGRAVVGSRLGYWVYGVVKTGSHEIIGQQKEVNPFAPRLIGSAGLWCGHVIGTEHCWTIENGSRVRLSWGMANFRFVQAAALSQRAIAEHWTLYGAVARLEKRAVWDFSLRRSIASWKPAFQRRVRHEPLEPDRCAISADGQFVAEGGDGVVRLYRLTP